MRRPNFVLAGLALLALVCALPARGGLLGSTLSWQYYAYGGPYIYPGGRTSGTFIANGGVGGTFIEGTSYLYFNIVANDASIVFDYSITTRTKWDPCVLSLPPTIHNGIAIDLISGPAFASVTINPQSNMAGFDASRVSFTESQIQVDWQGLSYDRSTIVKLDIATVPEPSTVSLIGLAAVALVVCRRRK